MLLWFTLVFCVVIVQRLAELRLAERNARRIREAGGFEVGAEHYKYIVLLHVMFFLSLLAEFTLRTPKPSPWMLLPAIAFLLLQAARVWCIRSLGDHWNTRIFVVPGRELVRKGPYRYVRHPNYAVVTLEMLVLPLCFGCYWTAAMFPLVNMLVLSHRMKVEENALLLMQPAMDEKVDLR
ncbi:isoprenylcysteine carboxyl methyltransferase family protein [Paenibacillus thermotolerans]|uniref:isoprenylcysteine carboxyl methyltransferase family protein n=1 Tax=Paenibacillus thermotolerans TaxID=3027807 RepID=UPI002367BCBC|nr:MULTISPECIES: isoprenylcysteine carboxylmethyltransferase family protein [unclassified Paenibacillus]